MLLVSLLAVTSHATAQEPRVGTTVTGRVVAAAGEPVANVLVSIEGTALATLTDTAGRYLLLRVPPGPQVIRAERLGYAATRISIVVPPTGTLVRNVQMAVQALAVEGVTVTADPRGRARGELGTASVIGAEAVRNQVAVSLAGVLELVPGVVLSPPGLDNVQQLGLRAAPTVGGGGDVASFGTLIILDGVPLSNNANLQSTGTRGEVSVATSAGGGIDLRRIPASTLERVEVIRGVPSARYGDLTHGAIVVDTRAGEFPAEIAGRYDARTSQGSVAGGRVLTGQHALSLHFDAARTRTSPGLTNDDVLRLAAQMAHSARFGDAPAGAPQDGRLLLDTRVDFYRLYSDNPEDPEIAPGVISWNRDRGVRMLERASLLLGGRTRASFTAAIDHTRQRSFRQLPRIRGPTPFTGRLTEGRAEGRFIGGQYLAPLHLEGDPWLLYGRLEVERPVTFASLGHELRLGMELRREWNDGPGYTFDIEFPVQTRFDGVQGFDRPRRFDAVPPVATSAFYFDDRVHRELWPGAALQVQAGVRADLLHRGSNWFTATQNAVLQPRLNAELSPRSWLRLRAGYGHTAKLPTLAALQPAPQYYDLVNVNRFSNDPAERLAVLTTFVRDVRNADLGFSEARKAEAGVEVDLGRAASIAVVAFRDRVRGAVGIHAEPSFLLRDRYLLTDTIEGNGIRPQLIEPPFATDTVPILLDRPANNQRLSSKGFEVTASLPEIRPLRTRVELQGAWIRSDFQLDDVDFGATFSNFQQNSNDPRAPYWRGIVRRGTRALLTSRAVHHEPELGLVITTTVQHTLKLEREDFGALDSLGWEGYVTRAGQLVRVPRERRADAEFNDLRGGRSALTSALRSPSDWMLSLQVAKTLPLDGRLSFYAFNALDRRGQFPTSTRAGLVFPAMRYGLELSAPARAFRRIFQ